ncbi:DUF4386 domain-containing protein [Flammeovirgaceae bacterium SG7u.111]|nr:DUF4386 domain-containing protein [Flammeovirgaceae bacterium SG7u.111]
MNSIRISSMKYARFAGLLYILIAIFSGFSMGYLPTILIAKGDAAATVQNFNRHWELFQLGLAADILVCIIEIVLSVILYQLFKEVNRAISMMAMFYRQAMAIIMGINLINYLMPVTLMNGQDYLSAFEPNQLESLALFFLEAHQIVVLIWGIFFGFHLVLLGYLVFRSGLFASWLGALLMAGGFGYVVESSKEFLFPQVELFSWLAIALLGCAVISELTFAILLLVKGRKVFSN